MKTPNRVCSELSCELVVSCAWKLWELKLESQFGVLINQLNDLQYQTTKLMLLTTVINLVLLWYFSCGMVWSLPFILLNITSLTPHLIIQTS